MVLDAYLVHINIFSILTFICTYILSFIFLHTTTCVHIFISGLKVNQVEEQLSTKPFVGRKFTLECGDKKASAGIEEQVLNVM